MHDVLIAQGFSELIQWLWPKLIQQELDQLRDHFNNHYVRKDRNKKNPSGVAPNVAMALPHKYNGVNCLQAVDASLIWKLKDDLGGDDLIKFVSEEFEMQAQEAFDSLGVTLALDNVWVVFQAMRRIMYGY